jgi:outer membrane protein assembly factor BamB
MQTNKHKLSTGFQWIASALLLVSCLSTAGLGAVVTNLSVHGWYATLEAGAKFEKTKAPAWPQWRGPSRDGQVAGPAWPDRLSKDSLTQLWRIPLGPSYSGPIVVNDLVFTTETKDKEAEIVYALDRKTGKERWRAEWKGAMTVPFFAASNGSWIRSTPAYDGERLYVAGMRDVLVCLHAQTGKEERRYDFVKELKTPPPDFGFVCSPLVAGDFVYVQAGASVAKLHKETGKIIWRTLQDQGGMFGSAFSSPVIATLAGKRQLVVQGREKLAGVDLASGETLWSQDVPSFRGMNILTPLAVGNSVFTSSYHNKAWLYNISAEQDRYSVSAAWTSKAQGYMSSPVVIDGYVYLHLQNQRFTCIDLKTGEQTWTSNAFGKYCSLVAQGNRILALDQRGILLLIKANPNKFELIDSLKVSEEETWAHLAVSGNELFIRELDALAVYRWQEAPE